MKVPVSALCVLLSMILTTVVFSAEPPGVTRSGVVSEMTSEGVRIDRFSVFSPAMQRDIRVFVVLPPAYVVEGDTSRYSILYTLHGRGAPYDTWAKMTRLREHLAKTQFLYAGFDADNASYYLDAFYPVVPARGGKDGADPAPRVSQFETFFFDEFLPAVEHWYRVNPRARGVTGFSMGGSGAMTYLVRRPEMFCSVSGLSTAFLDVTEPDSLPVKALSDKLGPAAEYPDRYRAVDHFIQLEEHLREGAPFPPLYQHIGSGDFLLELNRKFRKFAEARGLDLTYRETPGGHDWDFWHAASIGVADFHWRHFQRAICRSDEECSSGSGG